MLESVSDDSCVVLQYKSRIRVQQHLRDQRDCQGRNYRESELPWSDSSWNGYRDTGISSLTVSEEGSFGVRKFIPRNPGWSLLDSNLAALLKHPQDPVLPEDKNYHV